MGHIEVNSWSKKGAQSTRRDGTSTFDKDCPVGSPDSMRPENVGLVVGVCDNDIVATTKRTQDGEAVEK